MVRLDDSGDVTKCWLAPDELAAVERAAGATDWEREIAMQLMGRCGLRSDEVPYPCDDGLRWSEDGEIWLFEVRGKNTAGGAPKVRDAWMPEDVEENVRRFSRERGLDATESWVSVSPRSVRRWVEEAAEQVADDRGDDRFREVSSHDLRRSWANHHLVERGVGVREMMSIGGWSSYSAIEPYLNEPTESKIGAAVR
ncbi:site-specific integrase [Halorarius halobius]|uniref:site-specific integrase n=1 Tax=Halorarius halobius TaxID=2962671 RepID=UPI0020CCCC4B|nr:site-specific integrase [Halorarius halobius]